MSQTAPWSSLRQQQEQLHQVAPQASRPPSHAFTWDTRLSHRIVNLEILPAFDDVTANDWRLICFRAHLFPCYFQPPASISGGDTIDEARNNHFKDATVARIVEVGKSLLPSAASSVKVNLFRRLTELRLTTQDEFMYLNPLDETNLRYIPEVVQTQEICSISSNDIINLAVVFTMESLKDSHNLFSTCQGMAIAFLLQYRLSHDVMENTGILLVDLPDNCCRPFPSSYAHSLYHDCLPSQMWRGAICVKLDTTKLLGQYSQQQDHFAKEVCWLSSFTAEAWGWFMQLQFSGHNFYFPGCDADAFCLTTENARRIWITEIINYHPTTLRNCSVHDDSIEVYGRVKCWKLRFQGSKVRLIR